MAKLGDLVVRIGANTKQFNAKLGALKGQIRRDTKNIAAMGRNMSMGITAPLLAIGVTSFKVAADFEQSMAKVKAVSGATGDEFKSLEDNAKELGRTTRFTASEVSALQLEYAKLGFSADEITQVTAATLNLAQATGSDLAQSAEVAGATLRAFGLDATDTERVTDVMAASFSSSALDINSFQDSMKYVAPVAKAAGVSLEEATAMLGQLANNGIKGSQAGTSLRRILQEVAGTGQPFSEAMKMSADEVINLADAKDEVGRSASSAFLVLKEGMGDVAGLTTELQGAEGAAAAMAAIMDDTAEGAMKRMQSAIEGAQIEIGSALAPVMIKLAGIVGDLAQEFTTMSDGGKGMVFVLAGIAASIGPILMVLPGLVTGIKLARVAFAALNRTMMANPFGAVAAAIGLVVGAVIMLNNASSEGGDKVDDLKKSLGGLDLEQQAASINGAVTAQKSLVAELKAEQAALLELAPHKRSANSQAGRDLKKLEGALETANTDLAAMQGLEEGVALKLEELGKGADEAAGDESKGVNGLTASVKTLKTEIVGMGTQVSELVNNDLNLGNAFFGEGGADLMLEEFEEIEEGLDDGTESMIENFGKLKEAATNSMMKAVEVSNMFGSSFGAAVADVVSGEKTAGQALKGLAIQAIRAVIQMAKANVIANATSPANAANLLTGGLATPAFIVAGLSMLDGFLGGVTAFADGGIVSGPTMGLVGEYPGAKTNPEVIAPLDKLRGMLGGQAVQVTGKISGRDILLTSERNAIDRNRVRGF